MTGLISKHTSLPIRKAPAYVWCAGGNGEKINDLLARGTDEEKVALVKSLFRLWNGWRNESLKGDEAEEACSLFGEKRPGYGSRAVALATITPRSGQLRFWFGLPACFDAHHVDSCGANLLLEVSGDTESLRSVASEVMDKFRFTESRLSNGLFIYLDTRP